MRDPVDTDEHRVRQFEVQLTRTGLGLARRLGDGVGGMLLDRLIQLLAKRHPRAFAALGELPDACLLIDPVDAPTAMMLQVGSRVTLRACDRTAPADAAVRGPCAQMLDLLEGRIDGDALFFRRELSIEGDTALILALRNTLDGEEMDLFADIAASVGPLGRALPLARRNAGRALDALDSARRLLPSPLRQGLDALERRVAGQSRGA